MVVAFGVITTAQPVQDPARLEVTATGGALSYALINLSPYRIVAFEVYTQFTSGGFEHLGCSASAEVKSPKDLTLAGVCRLPIDMATGKPVNYSSRVVRVDFENSLTWNPGKSSRTEKR